MLNKKEVNKEDIKKKIKPPKMSRKSILITSAIGSLLLGISATAGVYAVASASNTVVEVPIVASDKIITGSKILAEDLTTIQVHPNSITPNMVTSANSIVGTYALKDMSKGEYLYSNWLSTDYYKRIADKAQYTAIPVPVSQFTSVNGEIKEDDFVMFSVIMGAQEGEYASDVTSDQLPEEKITILEPPQLSAVRILGVVDGTGLSTTYKNDALKKPNGQVDAEESLSFPSMLIVDVNDVQRTILLQAMNAGKIQAVILPEAEQQLQREKFGLVQSDVLEGSNTEDKANSTEMFEKYNDEQFKKQIQSEADRLGISYDEALKLYKEQQSEGGAN